MKKIITKIVEEITSFLYKGVGTAAQLEVQKAIERFRKLPLEERSKTPLLFWLLGSSTPPYKAIPSDVSYFEKTIIENQTCGNCHFCWIHAVNKSVVICSIVNENLLPNRSLNLNGWCDRWKPSTR